MSPSVAAGPLPRPKHLSVCEFAAMTDAQLLTHFFRLKEESAFAALLARHGPMVYGVCRRMLREASDAEDAFQATFLVLVRKGGTLRHPERLASWLYGVALRVARKAKARSAQQSKLQRERADMPLTSSTNDLTYQELCEILDDEMSKLPEKYAVPLVLCYLEGKTNAEAAAELGWPEGSMSRRLSRARELLRVRLSKRGLALTAALLASVFAKQAQAEVPPALIETTARAGGLVARGVAVEEVVATSTAELVYEVGQGLSFASKITLAAALMLLMLIGLAVSVSYTWGAGFGGEGAAAADAARAAPATACAASDGAH